ncbi:transcriptional repressor TraM [Rhizobium sp. CCGE531]|uniref:transcriptional repressor TraM n=1 Tax=Rhizobium sp. CCGE531 TaxID=2364271 RepID=UPI000EA9EF84|nr:transcriptional repressor TraM [Rhizobium sp. CCGE531]AYG66039.1 transcriptional regulator [Rhizobium sp. CCGE531]
MQRSLDIPAIVGLTAGLPSMDLQALTVDAIRSHRHRLEKAQQLWELLPHEVQAGKASGGAQHLAYIEAAMEMHAQMYVLNSLLKRLGYIPKVPAI